MTDISNERFTRSVIMLLVALVIVVPVVMILAMAAAGGWSDSGYDYGMMGSWAGGWGLMMIVPVGVVLLLIVILIIAVTDRPSSVVSVPVAYPPQPLSSERAASDPQSMLDMRLARGELSIEEYTRIKSELNRR